MKNFFSLSLLLLLPVVFGGCVAKEVKVAKVTMYVIDQTADAVVEMVPDYEKRTVEVVYKKDELKTGGKDEVAATGQVGGEYFDRFEKLVKFVEEKNGGAGLDDEKTDKGQSTFKVVVENVDKSTSQFSTYWDDSTEGLENLRSFYLDVTTMLTENEQV